MDKINEQKTLLNLQKSLLVANLQFTTAEIGFIIKIIQLYNVSNDVNLLKFAGVFLGAAISTSLVFDYAKDEYRETKKQMKYVTGDNYE